MDQTTLWLPEVREDCRTLFDNEHNKLQFVTLVALRHHVVEDISKPWPNLMVLGFHFFSREPLGSDTCNINKYIEQIHSAKRSNKNRNLMCSKRTRSASWSFSVRFQAKQTQGEGWQLPSRFNCGLLYPCISGSRVLCPRSCRMDEASPEKNMNINKFSGLFGKKALDVDWRHESVMCRCAMCYKPAVFSHISYQYFRVPWSSKNVGCSF